MTDAAWVRGDVLGIAMPVHPDALRGSGADFLTRAFRASGALGPTNRVVRITRCDDCTGGSTGRKLLLSVEYESPGDGLHRDLFAKFSRDFDDPVRDRGRTQMEAEVRFALLSRGRDFPITVPACYFADYHAETGSGLLITERVPFGIGAVERQYGKCLDEDMPEPLAHYEALLTALARLAGADRAGRLPADVAKKFPLDLARMTVGERAPYTPRQLQNRIERYARFAERYPVLLPENIRAPAFIERLSEEVLRVASRSEAIRRDLAAAPGHIALCHWNANVDNAWFWRDGGGVLQCGLMDWGCAGRMNVAMALWGALSAAQTGLSHEHLDRLLARFAAEFEGAGAAPLDLPRLRRQLVLYAALMGITWLLDAPAYIESQVPQLASLHSRFDAPIRDNEIARVQLQMLTNVLDLWDRMRPGRMLDESP